MKTAEASAYTPGEELANVATHAAGVALSVVALVLLVTFAALRGDAWQVVSAAVFGTSLVLLYTASTLYHSCRRPRARQILRVCDHSAIFLLIAGTYTPIVLVSLRGPWGWSLFSVVWGIALLGVVLKVRWTGRFRLLSTLMYVAMGWLVVIAVRPMLAVVPAPGLWLLLAGGLCYTGGAVFYLAKRLPYHHAVWHLFVLGGSICHFFAIFGSIIGHATRGAV